MKRFLYLGVLGTLLFALMTGCSHNSDPIRIGVNNWPPCEVWYIAQEKGFFQDVPVQLIRYSSWADNVASLYMGKIDITHSTYFNSVYYDGKGEDAVMVAPIDYSEGSDGLVIKNTLTSPEQLKGKRIGVELGTDEHYLLYKALERFNLKISDVELVSIPSYDSYKNFKAGEVDALFTYEPYLSQAASEGNGRIVFTTKEIPGHMVDALMARKITSEKRPEDIQKVMDGWYKALAYIQAHPEESAAIMAKNEEMAVGDFLPFFKGFYFYPQAEATKLLKSDELKDLLKEMSVFAKDNTLRKDDARIDLLLKSPMTHN